MKQLLVTICCLTAQFCFGQGSMLFNDRVLHTIEFEMADTTLLMSTEDYQQVNVLVDGARVNKVGLKKKGNISVGVPNLKVPLKIKCNKYIKGQEVDGIKEFMLHNNFQDPTLLREKLTYDIASDLGLNALRTAFAKVYINGQYWGVYTLLEAKDELYDRLFGDKDLDVVESLDFGNMCYISDKPGDYNSPVLPNYKLENGNAVTAFERFSKMIAAANNTPAPNYLDEAGKWLNLKHFFNYQALNVYLMNFDSYIGYKGNQLYLFDTIRQQWQIIPWDFNASINLWKGQGDKMQAKNFSLLPNEIMNGCIANKMQTVPVLRKYYLDAHCILASDVASSNRMLARIDQYYALIKDAVHSDWRKQYTSQQFDQTVGHGWFEIDGNEFEGLKTFFIDREQFITGALKKESFICTSNSNALHFQTARCYPNPAQDEIQVQSDFPIMQYEIFQMDGQLIHSARFSDPVISLAAYPPGTYYIRWVGSSGSSVQKLVIARP